MFDIPAGEEHLLSEHLAHDAAGRPQVDSPIVVGGIEEQLRRSVESGHLVAGRDLIRVDDLGRAEVADL